MSYDQWLLDQAEFWMGGCEPEPIERDEDGHAGTYNCEVCNNRSCEYWRDYND